MYDIKAKQGYNDYSPRVTKVFGEDPKILLDKDGKEHFQVKKDDILSVPNERGKYLVKEKKLAELVSIYEEN